MVSRGPSKFHSETIHIPSCRISSELLSLKAFPQLMTFRTWSLDSMSYYPLSIVLAKRTQWCRTLVEVDQQRRKCIPPFSCVQWLIMLQTGRRSDSAHAYIHSTRAVHSNLHLQCNTKVDKVIMENGKAVGVCTVPTKPLHASVSKKNSIDGPC